MLALMEAANQCPAGGHFAGHWVLLFFLTLKSGYCLAAGQMTFCALLVSPYVMASLLASPPCSLLCTLFCGCVVVVLIRGALLLRLCNQTGLLIANPA